ITHGTTSRYYQEALVSHPIDQSVCRITQPRGILRDHIQHGLYVRRRTGDDTKYFTRRGLLLQRLLKLVEQSHVLDGDHGLICECLEELDLHRGEGVDLKMSCREHPSEFSVLTKGNRQVGARAAERT